MTVDELADMAKRYSDTMGLTREGAVRRLRVLTAAILDNVESLKRQPCNPCVPIETVTEDVVTIKHFSRRPIGDCEGMDC